MTTTILRIQDAEGRGPFKPGFSQTWVLKRADHANLRPWTAEFGQVNAKPGMAYGCGCLTRRQLQRWFTKAEYTKLLEYGYRAVKIEVDSILHASTTQCVFERALPLNERAQEIRLYDA